MAFRRARWHALSNPADLFRVVVTAALTWFWGRDAMSLRVRRLIAVTGTTLATTAVTLTSVGATSAAGTAWTAAPRHASVVLARPGHLAEAAAAVRALGGKLGRPLTIVNGFTAQVSTAAAHRLNGSASVLSVTPDAPLASASIN